MRCARLKCEECRKPHRDDPTKNKRFRSRNAAWLMLDTLMDLRSFIDNFFFFSPREPRDFGSSGCCFARWRNLCSSESCYSRNVFLERSCNVRVVRKTVLRFTLKFFSNLILVFRTFHIGLRRLRVWHEIN